MQDDCECMDDVGEADVFLITSDAVVPRCRKYAMMIIMTGTGTRTRIEHRFWVGI